MPTHSRKHSDATQIAEKILKEAAKPRQPASVKEALKKEKDSRPYLPANAGWKQRWKNQRRYSQSIKVRSSPSSTAIPSKSCTTDALNHRITHR